MDNIIETIDLNALNQLRITVNEFQGQQRLDIRHWFREGMLKDNEWHPSKKGINLSIDMVSEFRKCLDRTFSRLLILQETGESQNDVGQAGKNVPG